MSPSRRARLFGCALFAALAVWLLGLGWLAFAQDAPVPVVATAPPITADPLAAALLALLQGGGWPAVIGLAVWWLRGVLERGVTFTVQLSAEDRGRADKLITVLDRRGRQVAAALDDTAEVRARGLDHDDTVDRHA